MSVLCALSGACWDDEPASPRPPGDAGPADDGGRTPERDARVEDSGRAEAAATCGGKGNEPVVLYEGRYPSVPGRTNGEPSESQQEVIVEESGRWKLDENSSLRPRDRAYRYVTLRAGEQSWRLVAPVSSFGVDVGDRVVLGWAHEHSVFYAPPWTRITIHAGDQLVFSHTTGYEVPEGFSVEDGAEQCRGEDDCATWIGQAVNVRGPCGDEVAVGWMQRAEVCGYEVVGGTLIRDDRRIRNDRGPNPLVCPDWWVKHTELTLVRIASVGGDADAGSL